ncbi:MAG: hypothetical protein RR989_09250 [Ruthenibacterium sp.]
MAKQGNIKHYRQTGAAKKPTALPFGEIAIAKDGTLYTGNESNVPVSRMASAVTADRLLGYKAGMIYANWDSPVVGAVNFKVDATEDLPVAKAMSCSGHAALDAYAPAEAVYKPQTGGESVIGVRSFYYPSQCNQNNCFVAAVLVNGKQIQCESTLSAGDISVQCGEVEPKVIVQRYK